MNSLERPRVAIAVRLEVFWSHWGSGLKHLHEHHVTHHPEQTCEDGRVNTPNWLKNTKETAHTGHSMLLPKSFCYKYLSKKQYLYLPGRWRQRQRRWAAGPSAAWRGTRPWCTTAQTAACSWRTADRCTWAPSTATATSSLRRDEKRLSSNTDVGLDFKQAAHKQQSGPPKKCRSKPWVHLPFSDPGVKVWNPRHFSSRKRKTNVNTKINSLTID